jgi:hypothetical protein
MKEAAIRNGIERWCSGAVSGMGGFVGRGRWPRQKEREVRLM